MTRDVEWLDVRWNIRKAVSDPAAVELLRSAAVAISRVVEAYTSTLM